MGARHEERVDYDEVGNRIHPPAGDDPMVYNAADQLTRWPGMHGDATHAGYTYYNDGSLHEVKNAGNTVTMASYTYTDTGLLATASYGSSRTLANEWDADSNRVAFEANGNEYEFVYDPTAGIPAVIEEVNSGASSTTTAYYFREPDGALIARHDGSGLHHYHFDQLGSTRLLTDSGGNITDKYAYDAYGSLLSHDRYTGSVDQPYQYVGELGYYTHYQEPEFGLLQLGVRFYEPEVGRFTSRDPVEDGVNRYSYAMDNPASGTDPTGFMTYFDACKDSHPNVMGYVGRWKRTETHHDMGKFLACLAKKKITDPVFLFWVAVCAWQAAHGGDFAACMAPHLGGTDPGDVLAFAECWDEAEVTKVHVVTVCWCQDECGNYTESSGGWRPSGPGWVEVPNPGSNDPYAEYCLRLH